MLVCVCVCVCVCNFLCMSVYAGSCKIVCLVACCVPVV